MMTDDAEVNSGLKGKQGALLLSLDPEAYQKRLRQEAGQQVPRQGVPISGSNLTCHLTIPNCKRTLKGFKTRVRTILEW